MRTIWKHTLAVTDATITIPMPENSVPIRFAMQNGVPCMWALVETESKIVQRTFRVHGTGHEIAVDADYCGSCDDPPFVWHLFEYPVTIARLRERSSQEHKGASGE